MMYREINNPKTQVWHLAMANTDPIPQKKRKNPYVAGVASFEFQAGTRLGNEEALKLYQNAEFQITVDQICYEDCITGMQQLPEGIVDLVIADPPFGIEFDGRGSQYNRNVSLVVEGYQEIKGDYDAFTLAWISELPRIMKETSSGFIFSGWTNLKDVLVAVDNAGLTVINHIIWKYQFGVFTQKKFVTSHYHVLFIVKNPNKYFFNKIEHYPLDIWDIPRTYRPGQKKNGTKLPESVVYRCIDFGTKPGDLVFDPFMGNGTSATCAKAKYRHFLGFELNQNMKTFLNENIQNTELGQDYMPYRTMIPPPEELAEKYSAVKRILSDKQKSAGSKSKKQEGLDKFF